MSSIFSVVAIEGLSSSERRGLAFLRCVDSKEINAESVYEALSDKLRRDVLSRFDHWILGQICDKYFHGWPNAVDRKDCFVFKYKKANADQRLYGFLTNPKTASAPSFQVCVLVSHTQKTTGDTDPAQLSLINRLRVDEKVVKAVRLAYSDIESKEKRRHA